MVTENTEQKYWRHELKMNDEEKSTMSRTLRMLDILEAGGVNGELDDSTLDRGEKIDIDPATHIRSSIFRRGRKWWIKYMLNGKKISASLRTRYQHIARIKQDEIDAILSTKSQTAFA